MLPDLRPLTAPPSDLPDLPDLRLRKVPLISRYSRISGLMELDDLPWARFPVSGRYEVRECPEIGGFGVPRRSERTISGGGQGGQEVRGEYGE